MSSIIELCHLLSLLLLSHQPWVQCSSVAGLSYDTFLPRNLNIRPVNATHEEITFRLEEDHRNIYWAGVQTVPESIAASDPRVLGRLTSSSTDLYRILARVDKTNRQPLYLVYEGFYDFKAANIRTGTNNDHSEDNKESEQENDGNGIKALLAGLFSEHRWTIVLSGVGIMVIISVMSAVKVARRWSSPLLNSSSPLFNSLSPLFNSSSSLFISSSSLFNSSSPLFNSSSHCLIHHQLP